MQRTDTRSLVRQIADEIAAQGGVPTSYNVKQRMPRGSATTIVDELRRWEAERKAEEEARAAELARKTDPLYLAGELTESVRAAAAKIEDLQRSIERSQLEAQTKRPDLLQDLYDRLAKVTDEIAAMSARSEAVQRRALLQIDEARTEAAKWRDKYYQSRDEAHVVVETGRQLVNTLREEVSYLRGRLNEPMVHRKEAPGLDSLDHLALTRNRETPAPAVVPLRRAIRYPGHPRAAYGNDEETE